MVLRKTLAAAIATLVLTLGALPGAAQAQATQTVQPQPSQPAPQTQRPQFVTQFDDATVTYLLQDIRATWQTEASIDGHTNYRANAEGGLNFTLSPRACSQETGCLGLMMLAVYTGVNASSLAELDVFLNRLNDTSISVKVFRNGDGIVVLQAYINAAGGITYRNAQSEFLVFGENIVAVSQALAQFERQR
ncbi:YbjN domain-containing protein [uncultured Erythrobacter sp.]|uniref:YbjN domain-containing protein n=1 Tax=uncultured Erythrobacter sp. TaxID=263913 RepID=UPI0026022DA5|nr:YbjN domain-containing protein [uncultured Erythrobacter sp.]